jgi:hypothetical protein
MYRVAQKFLSINALLEQGAHAGLFIVRGQMSYYNALKAPNHLPR